MLYLRVIAKVPKGTLLLLIIELAVSAITSVSCWPTWLKLNSFTDQIVSVLSPGFAKHIVAIAAVPITGKEIQCA